MSSAAAEQQHVEPTTDDVPVEQSNSDIDAAAPVLPPPQIDHSFSLDSILDLGMKDTQTEVGKLERLSEENQKLDMKLKEMQDRLAAAEQKSKELEAKRRSQQQLPA